jgi:putative sigma-54 modulation protein
MDLQIRANGTKVSDGLQEFIDRRMAKLDRIAEHVVEAHLELRTEELRAGNEVTTAQLTLQTGRHVLRAEERDAEAAKAIDAAIDKLIRQARKFNDKRAKRKRRSPRFAPDGMTATSLETEAAADSLDGGDEPVSPIVRTKRFQMKPMQVEEAIDQMELVGHDFFLFQNADEDQLNVLYRRRDGTFGLLAPARS